MAAPMLATGGYIVWAAVATSYNAPIVGVPFAMGAVLYLLVVLRERARARARGEALALRLRAEAPGAAEGGGTGRRPWPTLEEKAAAASAGGPLADAT